MKVSQEQKQATRRILVNTAADLFVMQGFDETSMKQIAREAGVGDATIYKYFPNKDKLLLGFYDLRAETAIEAYRGTADLDAYNLGEKIQLIIDTWLEQLAGDREFVALSLGQFSKSPLVLFKDQLKAAYAYKTLFAELLAETSEKLEDPIPMQSILAAGLSDFLLGLTLYWLRDESEEAANTIRLCDLSVGLIQQVIENGMLNKAMDLLGFLFKVHVMRGLQHGGSLLDLVKDFSSGMNQHFNAGAEKGV